jgi:hypothetical protein
MSQQMSGRCPEDQEGSIMNQSIIGMVMMVTDDMDVGDRSVARQGKM